jgi:hypothetical protein
VTSNISAYALMALLVLCAVVVVAAAGTIVYRLLWRHPGHRRRVRLDEADERWRAAEAYGATDKEEPPYPPADRPMMAARVEGRPPWELAHEPAPFAVQYRLPDAETRGQLLAGLAPETLDVSAEAAAVLIEALDSSPVFELEPKPELVLPAPGGWVSGPCLDVPEPAGPGFGDYLAERTPAGEMWLIRWADRLPSWRIGLEPA